MARVVTSGCLFLTISTTSAFCLGETLQAKTTEAFSASSKNSFLTLSFFEIFKRDSPATMTLFGLANYVSFYNLLCSVIWSMISLVPLASTMKVSISVFKSAQEYPILIAVSILSPVNTHTLMPAFLIKAIVSPTSS